MDTNTTKVAILELRASETEYVHLTNAGCDIVYDTETYTNADGLSITLPSEGIGFNDDDCLLEGLSIEGSFLTLLSNHAPFSVVYVSIKELTIDDDLTVTATDHIFDGLLYQAKPKPLMGYMDLVCKEWGYYTDAIIGIPCTEMCAYRAFGQKGCNKVVHSEVLVVESVSGLNLQFVSPPLDTTSFLFNKGYVEYQGMRIKIKYHESGIVFQLSKGAPLEWLGKSVSIYAGCDRSLTTCRTVHDNESQFLGLGYSMVDYNAFYENF